MTSKFIESHTGQDAALSTLVIIQVLEIPQQRINKQEKMFESDQISPKCSSIKMQGIIPISLKLNQTIYHKRRDSPKLMVITQNQAVEMGTKTRSLQRSISHHDHKEFFFSLHIEPIILAISNNLETYEQVLSTYKTTCTQSSHSKYLPSNMYANANAAMKRAIFDTDEEQR